VVKEQLLGAAWHRKPGSSLQVGEQPSSGVVLPSSHASAAAMMPSPHLGVHGLPGTRHCQPASTLWQSAEHPSPPVVLPSSQPSLAVAVPFPQRSHG